MFKRDRIFLYKVIAIVSAIILCLVQLLHIRNAYKLEEEVYNIDEKKIIKTEYEESIINDKVFPGGVIIIDSIIYRNLPALELLALNNNAEFKALSARVSDTIFTALHASNNMDSFLTVIKRRHKIDAAITYSLFVERIDMAIEPNHYYNIFNNADKTFSGAYPYKQNLGAWIGGNLETNNPQTLTSSIKVSAMTPHSYRMNFSLYCDRPDRLQKIIILTLPQTLLSIFSIIAVLVIFFLTFSNWVRQKKMTEMKTDFINTITHEFQTPLTAIMVANKTMEHENITLKSPKLSSLNVILQRQTERLSVLIKQVTETSREEPIRLILDKINVNSLLEDIIADYQLNIENTSAKVDLDKKAKNDLVALDKLHFTSIVLNIINNGITYNQKQWKQILVTTSNRSNDTLILSIKDNGDGMSNKVRKKIFYRFYRNPSLTNNNGSGLGLGLYYTKQCLDAHHWKYEVKSSETTGTEFIIYIPLSSQVG